jgi:hypothetical protein
VALRLAPLLLFGVNAADQSQWSDQPPIRSNAGYAAN